MNYDGRMILVVTGGRNHPPFKIFKEQLWLDRIREAMEPVYHVQELWHGAAKGADSNAEAWAFKRGLIVCQWPAEWGKYGKAAGRIRNRRMVREMQRVQDLCVLLSFPGGRGTAHMTNSCREAGLNVFTYPGPVPGHKDIVPFCVPG